MICARRCARILAEVGVLLAARAVPDGPAQKHDAQKDGVADKAIGHGGQDAARGFDHAAARGEGEHGGNEDHAKDKGRPQAHGGAGAVGGDDKEEDQARAEGIEQLLRYDFRQGRCPPAPVFRAKVPQSLVVGKMARNGFGGR